jgi:hypothetical protein
MESEAPSSKADKVPWWKIILGTVVVIIALPFILFGLIQILTYPDYQKSAAAEPRVRAAADQFKAGKDWTLTTESSHGPGAYCIDIRCPSIAKHWNIGPTPPNADEIRSLINDSGYVLTDTCNQIKPVNPLYPKRFNYSCTTTPVADPSISITFYISEPDFGEANAPYEVHLFVARASSTK